MVFGQIWLVKTTFGTGCFGRIALLSERCGRGDRILGGEAALAADPGGLDGNLTDLVTRNSRRVVAEHHEVGVLAGLK